MLDGLRHLRVEDQLSHNNGLVMAKRPNVSGSTVVSVTVSVQSAKLLEHLAAKGIYGKNGAEVAARFIDKALEQFVETPKLKLDDDGLK